MSIEAQEQVSIDDRDQQNIILGIDAGFDVLIELANRGMVTADSRGEMQAFKAFYDLVTSIAEHRQKLGGQALWKALLNHQQLQEEGA